MIISIDESGIHKQNGKSVIAFVCVAVKNLEVVERLVLNAEKMSGIHGFHWAHRNWQMRQRFIEGIAGGDFIIKVAYVENPITLDKALTEALEYLIEEPYISQILIDGDKPKTYARRLKKVLRDKGITAKKIRSVNDQSYPIIRVADAVAGVTRAAYDSPKGKAAVLLALLESKIERRVYL